MKPRMTRGAEPFPRARPRDLSFPSRPPLLSRERFEFGFPTVPLPSPQASVFFLFFAALAPAALRRRAHLRHRRHARRDRGDPRDRHRWCRPQCCAVSLCPSSSTGSVVTTPRSSTPPAPSTAYFSTCRVDRYLDLHPPHDRRGHLLLQPRPLLPASETLLPSSQHFASSP